MTADNLSQYLNGLKPKHAIFVRNLTDKNSPTFDNLTQSYLKAGYASKNARSCAKQLATKHQKVIDDIRSEYAKHEQWSTFDDWYSAGLKCFNELDSKSANRLGFWQSLGKAKGWLGADNQVNAIMIGADDLAKLRQSISNKLNQGIATVKIESDLAIDNLSTPCVKTVDNYVAQRGEGVEGGDPPTSPLCRHTTPLQSAHNFTPSPEVADLSVDPVKTYVNEATEVTTDFNAAQGDAPKE